MTSIHREMTMGEVAHILGFTKDPTKLTVSARRKTIRRLKSAERDLGEKILNGGGASGADYWTTPSQLRQALPGLRFDETEIDEIRQRCDSLEEELSELREVLALLTQEVAHLRTRKTVSSHDSPEKHRIDHSSPIG